MTITTQCDDRRSMVRMISEHLSTPATYLRTPTYAFQIGELLVNRDGSITGEPEALNQLLPFLRDNGFASEDVELETPQDEEDTMDKQPTTAPRSNDRYCMDISFEITDWTISQLTNLMRMLCSKQYIIRKMLRTDDLHIARDFVEELSKTPPESPADFEARVTQAAENGLLQGMNLTASAFTLATPYSEAEPQNWTFHSDLIDRILKQAKGATRVRLAIDEPENEKYAARAFLLRLGYGGADQKAARSFFLDHLQGYAAFREDAGMQAHKEKLAAKRQAARQADLKAEGGDTHD